MTNLFPGIPLASYDRRFASARLLGCQICPLAKVAGNKHPQMPASGAEHPLVYILGEAPGADEDEEGVQFVGASGQLLRPCIPREFRHKVRFNNVVRTWPGLGNPTPGEFAVECCRPSIVKDIEQSKPKAIFGFGNVPLNWVSGFTGIMLWRGRRMPVRVGSHICWYYAMAHPAHLLHLRREGKPTEDERVFRFDVQRAFAEIGSLPKPRVHTAQDALSNIECITDGGEKGLRRIEKNLRWAAARPNIGIDYETDRLRPYAEGARILSAAVDDGIEGFAFPFQHPEAQWSEGELARLCDLWYTFLRTARGNRYVHNLAFELEWTGVMFGSHLLRAGAWHDTASQACILDERTGKQKPGCFSLEFLVQQYFGFNLKKLSNLDRANLAAVPLEVVLRYNGGDARYHCLLGLKQKARIKQEGLQEAYKLALRRVPTVVLTQMKGIPVDQNEVRRLHNKYNGRFKAVEKDIRALPVVKEFERIKRQTFNPMSNRDVLFILWSLLKCQECWVEDKFSGKLKQSVDKNVLDKISHPLAGLLVELRESNKRDSTYILPLMKGAEESVIYDDGLLHPVFNTFFSEAGRLSAEVPNIQNFPKRDSEAKEIRKQIVAALDCVIMAFDYGQIEARVIAMFTKDKAFCKALWEKYDIHMEWAERLARAYPSRIGGKKNLTDKKVMKDLRTDVKNQWVFPLFFGARMESVADYLKIPVEKVKPEYDRFWRVFSGVKEWQDRLIESYHEYGYVSCLTGRRRHGPLSVNKIINSPVQGTAAEIVMDGMSRLSEIGDMELQPEINIHDDLTYCRVPVKKVDTIAERVIGEMLKVPFDWAKVVPVTVEMSVGSNWLEMSEVGTFSSNEWFGK